MHDLWPLYREWYYSGAILLSAPLSQRVISALYDLSDVDFDLPVEGIDLDEMWPSFVLWVWGCSLSICWGCSLSICWGWSPSICFGCSLSMCWGWSLSLHFSCSLEVLKVESECWRKRTSAGTPAYGQWINTSSIWLVTICCHCYFMFTLLTGEKWFHVRCCVWSFSLCHSTWTCDCCRVLPQVQCTYQFWWNSPYWRSYFILLALIVIDNMWCHVILQSW